MSALYAERKGGYWVTRPVEGAASIKRDAKKGWERKERETDRQRGRALSQVLAALMRMLISLMQTSLTHTKTCQLPSSRLSPHPFFPSEPERLTLMCSSRLRPCRCSDYKALFCPNLCEFYSRFRQAHDFTAYQTPKLKPSQLSKTAQCEK